MREFLCFILIMYAVFVSSCGKLPHANPYDSEFETVDFFTCSGFTYEDESSRFTSRWDFTSNGLMEYGEKGSVAFVLRDHYYEELELTSYDLDKNHVYLRCDHKFISLNGTFDLLGSQYRNTNLAEWTLRFDIQIIGELKPAEEVSFYFFYESMVDPEENDGFERKMGGCSFSLQAK